MLREVGQRLGLFEALDQAIPDPRWLRLVVHEQETMLAQRIVAIALGYEDLNDHQALRADPGLRLAAGQAPSDDLPLASPPTPCRLEDRVNRKALVRVAEVLVDQFAAHPEPPEALILDFDATDDPVHGKREGRFFHGYYDQPMIITAACPCTSSAETSCWPPPCGPATSTRASTPGPC